MTDNNGPLAGITVIDLTRILAGPFCTQLLGDLGANVIKIERPGSGDDTRRFGPPYLHDEAGAKTGESAYFMSCNRNKRSVAIDISSSEGQALLRSLIERADVLVENFKVGNLARYGLGYDDLKSINPSLIYCAISGFGRSGPYASRGGYDLIAQGMSGLMSITGEGPGRPPVKVGGPVCDITAGILAAMGILAAYIERQKTGQGQMVDTSLFEAGITHTYWQSAIALATGIAPEPMGSAHPLNGPYQAVETADGWITFSGANSRNWERLTELLGRSDLTHDPLFKDNAGRMANSKNLMQILNLNYALKIILVEALR